MKSSKDYLNLIQNNPIAIGHAIGFTDLTELHNIWIKDFIFRSDDFSLQAHRNSYKTSCVALAIALLMILRPNKNIMFIRKTDTDVKEIVKTVANILKHDVFVTIVYALYGVSLAITLENAFELTTNLFQEIRGTAQMLGCGIKGNLTGKHFDYIFTDDIITLKDRISRAEREFTKDIYKELQNIKTKEGRICNTGTPWHKEDTFTLMPNLTKYNCYVTGIFTKQQIDDKRASMTSSLFAANYELVHIAADNVMFADPQYEQEQTKIFNGIAHIDASYGGKDATAFTGCRRLPTGEFILFGKRWPQHVDKCMSEIKSIIQELKLGTVWCETNADKGYLAKELRKLGLHVGEYHEAMNKFVKISTHLKGSWIKVKFLEGTDMEYINEILDYNENMESDDCPDSAASVIRQLNDGAKWGWAT